MKTYKILFIFILISKYNQKSHGQNTFFDSYGWSLGTGLLINTADSCYMGFANDNISSQHINLYKLNPLGKLLWVKNLPFAAILPAIQMISLSDSSVAFIGQQVLPYVLVVIKADLNGNLIWTKTLTIPNSFNFTSLAPTTDGGLILTGGVVLDLI
ncbi:MAG: PQQ-like beta-propeller repeat protein [Bacteroidetes bacterium]|nr:PQQ-like beta-propeller repeat protein [Bacteroidota bacterium]